jgi:hypothetical protein
MAFIHVVDNDESFTWTPTDPSTGEPYESSFDLRIVSDDAVKDLRKKYTKQVFSKDDRKMVDRLDDVGYVGAVLDYAITGWRGIKAATTGEELPCTAAMKARLPERWKAEIFRLCAAKEAGDVVARADEEKKLSRLTSNGSATS